MYAHIKIQGTSTEHGAARTKYERTNERTKERGGYPWRVLRPAIGYRRPFFFFPCPGLGRMWSVCGNVSGVQTRARARVIGGQDKTGQGRGRRSKGGIREESRARGAWRRRARGDTEGPGARGNWRNGAGCAVDT